MGEGRNRDWFPFEDSILNDEMGTAATADERDRAHRSAKTDSGNSRPTLVAQPKAARKSEYSNALPQDARARRKIHAAWMNSTRRFVVTSGTRRMDAGG